MIIEPERLAAKGAFDFVDAVTEHETMVEHRNLGVFVGQHRPVYVIDHAYSSTASHAVR